MDQAEKYSLALNKTFDKFEKYMNKMEKYTGIHLKCTDQVRHFHVTANIYLAQLSHTTMHA